MGVYSLRALTTATPGSATPEFCCNFWNPSSTVQVKLLEAGFFRGGTTAIRFVLQRTSARGTAGTQTMAGATNSWGALDAPLSGVFIDTNYSAEPTAVLSIWQFSINTGTGSTGAGAVWTMPQGVYITPGSGIGFRCATGTTVIPASDVYFVWEEA